MEIKNFTRWNDFLPEAGRVFARIFI